MPPLPALTEKTLAAAMLGSAPTVPLADLLLEVGDRSPTTPVLTRGQISAAAAERMAPQNPAWAMAAAADPDTDPELLTTLSTHENPRVRERVRANPSTPMDTILTQFDAFVAKRDVGRAAQVLHRVDPVQWLTAIAARGLRPHGATCATLIEQVADDPDTACADILVQLASSSPSLTELRSALGAAATRHGPFRLPEQLLNADTAIVSDFVRGIVRETGDWTNASTAWLCQAAHRLEGCSAPTPITGRTLAASQARQLAAHPSTLTLRLLVTATNAVDVVTTDLIDEIARNAAPIVCRAVLDNHYLLERASAAHVDALVARADLASDPAGFIATNVLGHPDAAALSPETVVKVLTHASPTIIGQWVTGRYPSVATEQMVHALAHTAQFLQVEADPSADAHDHRLFALTVLDCVDRRQVAPGTGPNILDTLMGWAGTQVLQRAAAADSGNVYAAHLVDRITARFGTDPAAWSAVLRLAPEFTGDTVTSLLDTVEAVLAAPAPAPAPALRSGALSPA